MSIDRRKFLRDGVVAALAAVVTTKVARIAYGQGARKDRDGNPADRLPAEFAPDPLSYYTKSAFMACLNSTFLLQAGALGAVAVTLTEVKDTDSSDKQAGRESFSMVFQSDAGPALSQRTYGVEHAVLGAFSLFLVPGGATAKGQSYVAIIDRLDRSPEFFAAPVGAAKASGALTRGEPTSVASAPTPTGSNASPNPIASPTSPKKTKLSWKRRDSDEFLGSIDQ